MDQLNRLGAHSISPAALATLGVTSSNKSLSMSTLGLFGSTSPPPPKPVHVINGQSMIMTIGRMM